MSTLSEQTCEACRADAPQVAEKELPALLREIPAWQVIEQDGMKQLMRCYRFNNFVSALAFTQQIGELAEEVGHHPALLTEWGQVTVRWWTHKINGLHRNDFIMASRTDDCFQQAPGRRKE